MSPQRIQRQRTKGWRMPPGAVYVGRPSKWGNPITREIIRRMWDDRWGPCTDTAWRIEAVRAYRHSILTGEDYVPTVADVRADLVGKDLACWCPLADADGNPVPCHADVLLRVANEVTP